MIVRQSKLFFKKGLIITHAKVPIYTRILITLERPNILISIVYFSFERVDRSGKGYKMSPGPE